MSSVFQDALLSSPDLLLGLCLFSLLSDPQLNSVSQVLIQGLPNDLSNLASAKSSSRWLLLVNAWKQSLQYEYHLFLNKVNTVCAKQMGFSYKEINKRNIYRCADIPGLSPRSELLCRELPALLNVAANVQKGPLLFGDLLFSFCEYPVFSALNIPRSSQ